MSEPMTLAQIIFKLSVFLSPEEARELARQMAEHFPPDLAANMSAGLDMALIAMQHEEPGRPRLFMGGAAHDAREDEGGLRACVQEHNLQQIISYTVTY